MSDVSVRVLTRSDVPAANELRRLVGWNQTEEDWHRMLALEPHGCFAAMQSDHLVGTVTTTSYGQDMAWIGMMLVHPERRRQGIGRKLMLRAIEYLDGLRIRDIRLDATPAGLPLYLQLGFIQEWVLTRWHRQVTSPSAAHLVLSGITRALCSSDWPAVARLDARAFGLERENLLRTLAQNCRAILVWPAQGSIEGWGMLRPGSMAEYLGPVACESADGIRALVNDLLLNQSCRPVVWDITDQQEPVKQLAISLGFEPVRPLTRMCLRHQAQLVPHPSLVAIADPALG